MDPPGILAAMSPSLSVSRVPFDPVADVDAVVAFCLAHPVHPYPEPLLRRLLLSLVSGPEGVTLLHVDGALALVATTADAATNDADCAVLDICGLRPELAPLHPALLDAAAGHAEAFVRAGARRGLDIPVPPGLPQLAPVAQSRGYRRAFVCHVMHTPAMPAPPEVAPPGPAWRWIPVDAAHVDAYHAVVLVTMSPVPGSHVPNLADFRASRLGAAVPDHLLLDGDRIAGFACVLMRADAVGFVQMLGRHPDYRGRGLGPCLLTHAMQRLAGLGAPTFSLEVAATNDAALDLYRRHGFRPTAEEPCYRRFWRDVR